VSCEPVRLRALEILLAVAEGDDLDPLLDQALNETADPRAAAFLAELVRGTLQWQGRYDHVIASFSRKRPPTDPVLVAILRLALHQMLGLDGVPAYAAIHQAGELCHRRAGRGKVAFINGMLQAVRRQVLGEKPTAAGRERALRNLFASLENDRPRWLAAWHSLPPWLVTRWVKNFGSETAGALCAATNETVGLHLHVLGGPDVSVAQAGLEAAGIGTAAGPTPGSLVVTMRPGRNLLRQCLGQMPSLIVQDVSVQAATAWLASGLPVARPLAVRPVLDLCAAPGGKAAHLRALLPEATALVAMDTRPDRVRLLQETLGRVTGGQVPLLMADGLHPPFAAGTFGGILLDGPCSGTGVLRHHPDGRWRLKAKTPAHMASTLLKLADQAAGLLAPGGRLMYATCSLEPEENDQVLAALVARRGDLVPEPADDGQWRRYWLPSEPVMSSLARGDGFFAARLRKVEQGGPR
jgi:16S rRNA (cytosine967-C5)-methyltransferase